MKIHTVDYVPNLERIIRITAGLSDRSAPRLSIIYINASEPTKVPANCNKLVFGQMKEPT